MGCGSKKVVFFDIIETLHIVVGVNWYIVPKNNLLLKRHTILYSSDLRLKNKLSQEQLSLKAELDPKYINKLENGRYKIRLETLSKILDALQVDYLDFFELPKISENNIVNELLAKLAILSEEEQILKVKAILQLLK